MSLKVESDKFVLYNDLSFLEREPQDRDTDTMHERDGFSEHQAKRMKHIIDNMVSQYEAVGQMNMNQLKDLPSSYFITRDQVHKWSEGGRDYSRVVKKTYDRHPVFLTLTVPDQQVSDGDIKRKCLEELWRFLKKRHNLVQRIWKAESQRRGDIHFHCLVDCWIDHMEVRRKWYELLDSVGCCGSLELKKATRLIRMNVAKDVNFFKAEIGGYMVDKEDKYGRLMYKHYNQPGKPKLCRQCKDFLFCRECLKEGKGKRITQGMECEKCEKAGLCGSCEIIILRKIEGDVWGRSRNLVYPAMTITDYQVEDIGMLNRYSLDHVDVTDSNDIYVATVFMTRLLAYESGKPKPKIAKVHPVIDKMRLLYHYEKLIQAYNGNLLKEQFWKSTGMVLTVSDHRYLYANGSFKVSPSPLLCDPKKERKASFGFDKDSGVYTLE